MKILEIDSSNGRDLYARMKCSCFDKSYAGTNLEKIMTTTIKFTGYNDEYFFKTVNKEPRERFCDCGKKFLYQWKEDGVHVEEVSV